jgi:hypothetical protein
MIFVTLMCLMRGVSLKRVDALRVERVDLQVMGYMIPRRLDAIVTRSRG